MSAPLHTHTNPMLECSVGTCVRTYVRTYTLAFTPARPANALRAPHSPTHRWHTLCHRWPAVCATVHQSNNKHHTMQTQYTTSIRTYMHMCSLHMQQTVLVVHAYICTYIHTYVHTHAIVSIQWYDTFFCTHTVVSHNTCNWVLCVLVGTGEKACCPPTKHHQTSGVELGTVTV